MLAENAVIVVMYLSPRSFSKNFFFIDVLPVPIHEYLMSETFRDYNLTSFAKEKCRKRVNGENLKDRVMSDTIRSGYENLMEL